MALGSSFKSDSDPSFGLQRALMAEFDLPYKAVSNAEFEVIMCNLVNRENFTNICNYL